MRKFIGALVMCTVVATGTPASAASGLPGPDWRERHCRYQSLDDRGGFSTFEIKVTIRCSVKHFSVPGGYDTALCYAEHESGLNEFAANTSSSAKGVFQTVDGTWDTIRTSADAMRRRWDLTRSDPGRYGVWHGRFHVVAVIRYVSQAGWGAWSNFAQYHC